MTEEFIYFARTTCKLLIDDDEELGGKEGCGMVFVFRGVKPHTIEELENAARKRWAEMQMIEPDEIEYCEIKSISRL